MYVVGNNVQYALAAGSGKAASLLYQERHGKALQQQLPAMTNTVEFWHS